MNHGNQKRAWRRRVFVGAALGLAVAFTVTACAPSSAPAEVEEENSELGTSDEDYSLEALIAAAKKEDPITVYDVTGKIVETAENFTAEYGVQATGVKMKANEQQELIIREAQAGNVQSDVFLMTDAPTVTAQLIPEGQVVSWFPPDLADVVPEEFQSPVTIAQEVDAWTYNTEVYGDTCPIDNMWAVTTGEWEGKVVLSDPLLRPDFMHWLNQVETHGDDLLADAYEDYFDEPLKTVEASATAEWVKRLAANQPLLQTSGGDVAEVIGAPGQSDPFIGFVSTAEYRENEASGFKLGLCTGIDPWLGRAYSKVAVIAVGTDSPNAAKLFVHYLLTEEGIAPQLADGKISTNTTVPVAADEASGIADVWDQVFVPTPASSADDFSRLPDWQDFWTTSNR